MALMWWRLPAAQELTNVIWSYAKLGTAPSLGFLADVAAVSLKQIGMFKAQELSSLLWAFAVFCFHPGTTLTRDVGVETPQHGR
jgi:hypothetical protein